MIVERPFPDGWHTAISSLNFHAISELKLKLRSVWTSTETPRHSKRQKWTANISSAKYTTPTHKIRFQPHDWFLLLYWLSIFLCDAQRPDERRRRKKWNHFDQFWLCGSRWMWFLCRGRCGQHVFLLHSVFSFSSNISSVNKWNYPCILAQSSRSNHSS